MIRSLTSGQSKIVEGKAELYNLIWQVGWQIHFTINMYA
jgi:hypothetical protein